MQLLAEVSEIQRCPHTARAHLGKHLNHRVPEECDVRNAPARDPTINREDAFVRANIDAVAHVVNLPKVPADVNLGAWFDGISLSVPVANGLAVYIDRHVVANGALLVQ